MKKISLISLIVMILTTSMAFAADEIHWTFTGPNSVAFDWRGSTTEKTIGYGLTSGVYTQVTATTPNPVPVSSSGSFWEANLTGLTANTLYYYKLGTGPEQTFRTPPAMGSSNFNVYALGNMGSSSTYFNTGAIQDIIANDLPSFVVGLGDLSLGSINGTATIDQHFNDVMAWSKAAAYMPVWGDLEWISSSTDSFKNYKGRFAVPNSQKSPVSPLGGGKDWYWFDYGNTRFITLPEPWSGAWSAWNTTAGNLMAQAQADPNIKFIATFGHRSAYSSGHYSGSATLKGMLDKLGDTYSKYTLNINGHSNNYERSFPQHGVTHVTVGTGGANLTQDGTCLWLTCTKPVWSAFRAMHLGALKLRFTSSGIEGSFICGPAGGGKNDVNCKKGSVVDKFAITSPTVNVEPSAIVAPMAAVAPMATALPDVIVTSLSYAKGIFTSTVKNQGAIATPTATKVSVRYLVDGVEKAYGSIIGSLAAGASITIGTNSAAYVIPTGTHTITSFADPVNRFVESNETNNTLSRTITDIDTQAPTVPTGLSAVAASSSQINLSWTASTDNVGVTGYKIFRNGSQVGTATAGTTYNNTGLSPSTVYSYTVTAYDAVDNSSTSSKAISATTKAVQPAPFTGAAFLGAQGGGAKSKGGRGGIIVQVTNLNNSGTGSLRACVDMTVPRTCVFSVGGTIHLLSPLNIGSGKDYLTIAGQTAPGGGIQLESKGLAVCIMNINAHDIILRYIKFRKGYAASCTYANQGCGTNITIFGGYNIMLDHLSLAWSMDDSLGIWGTTDVHDVTVQNIIIAEGFVLQSTAIIIGSNSKTNIDIHHNYMVSFNHRGPLYENDTSREVNNIFYNMKMHFSQLYAPVKLDSIGNIKKKGPLSSSTSYEYEGTTNPSVYLSGNIGPHQASSAGDQWAMARQAAGYNGNPIGPMPTAWHRTAPLANTPIPITAEPVANLAARLMPIVGASRRLDCSGNWVNNRDTTDTRLVNQFANNTGNRTIIANEGQVGGYPVIANGTPCADADHDGMPNAWELEHGLNPNNAADRNTISISGYTNVENYLNGQ